MAMDVHIGNICNKPFKGLYNIRQIRKFLSTEATKILILIHAFMTSHLDYCNSLFTGLPKISAGLAVKYLNAAARIICLVPKFDRISPYLKDLHWLSVELRIELKVLLRVFKALNGMAPRYISSGIRHFTTIASNLAICLANLPLFASLCHATPFQTPVLWSFQMTSSMATP